PAGFMLTMKDDEKALFKETLTFEDTYKFAIQNAKDIISCGFDMKKTFIYSDLEYVKGQFLMNVWEFSKLITFNQVRGAFGFNERLAPSFSLVHESTMVGKIHPSSVYSSYFPPTLCPSSLLYCTNTLQH